MEAVMPAKVFLLIRLKSRKDEKKWNDRYVACNSPTIAYGLWIV